jgi:hypothetical protein
MNRKPHRWTSMSMQVVEPGNKRIKKKHNIEGRKELACG